MAKKYNFSITIPVAEGFSETLQVIEGDSFDEVIRIVEKAAKERIEELAKRKAQNQPPLIPTFQPQPLRNDNTISNTPNSDDKILN